MLVQGHLRVPAQLLHGEGGETRPSQSSVVLAFLRLCSSQKHSGVRLTSASKEIRGTKPTIKSNMCLRAFLDQGLNDQLILPQGALPWNDSWLFFSDGSLPACFLPIYYHLQVKQTRLLNPHSKEHSGLQIPRETNSTHCPGDSGKPEVSFGLS